MKKNLFFNLVNISIQAQCSPTNLFLRHWLSEWGYQLSGLVRTVIIPPVGVLRTVEFVWREVLLSETTTIQTFLHKLLINHTCCCVVLWLRLQPTVYHGKREIDVFHLKSHHIITMSRRGTAGTSCFLLLGTDAVTLAGAGTKHRYRQTGDGFIPHLNSAFFLTLTIRQRHHIPHTISLIFGPVLTL